MDFYGNFRIVWGRMRINWGKKMTTRVSVCTLPDDTCS